VEALTKPTHKGEIMDRVARNIRVIVMSQGNWFIASVKAFAILSGSAYPTATVERRLSGEPHYESEDDKQDAISYEEPEAWKCQGGARIVAGQIKNMAAAKIGTDWSVIVLNLTSDPAERRKAIETLSPIIASHFNCQMNYAGAICNRWYEDKAIKRNAELLSREYRIKHYHSIADLVLLHHLGRDGERADRSDILNWLDSRYEAARDRLEAA